MRSSSSPGSSAVKPPPAKRSPAANSSHGPSSGVRPPNCSSAALDVVAELVVGLLAASAADQAPLVGQELLLHQAEERRQDQALGQIAGGTEEDEDGGAGGVGCGHGAIVPVIVARPTPRATTVRGRQLHCDATSSRASCSVDTAGCEPGSGFPAVSRSDSSTTPPTTPAKTRYTAGQ